MTQEKIVAISEELRKSSIVNLKHAGARVTPWWSL